MFRNLFFAAVIAVTTAVFVQPASAQTEGMWIDRDRMVQKLAGEFAETPTALGLASTGGVVELFATPGGDTWTIVITMPNGLSRIIVAGEGWSTMPVTIAGFDS